MGKLPPNLISFVQIPWVALEASGGLNPQFFSVNPSHGLATVPITSWYYVKMAEWIGFIFGAEATSASPTLFWKKILVLLKINGPL